MLLRFAQSALRLKPTFTDAYNNMASALVQKGLVPAALQCYQTALAVNPNLVLSPPAPAQLRLFSGNERCSPTASSSVRRGAGHPAQSFVESLKHPAGMVAVSMHRRRMPLAQAGVGHPASAGGNTLRLEMCAAHHMCMAQAGVGSCANVR